MNLNLQNKLVQTICGLFAVCLLSFAVFGQAAAKINQNEFVEARHQSRLLAREVSYRIILPADYKPLEKKRFAVIYLLHGRGGNYKDWTNLTKITEYSLPYNFIIVMPDGGKESWYADNINLPNENYESYFVKELIPEIDAKYRTLPERQNRIIAGLSIGGYGAVKFGLKYPEKFVLAGSFSGAMDAVVKTQNYKHLIKSVADVFGEENSQARKDNDIFKIINEASAEKIKEFPFLFVDCGTEDHQFQSNRDFAVLLTDKKVPHEYRQKPGVHNWAFWDAEVREFLRVADKLTTRQTPQTVK